MKCLYAPAPKNELYSPGIEFLFAILRAREHIDPARNPSVVRDTLQPVLFIKHLTALKRNEIRPSTSPGCEIGGAMGAIRALARVIRALRNFGGREKKILAPQAKKMGAIAP